jgi:hypothetical protein
MQTDYRQRYEELRDDVYGLISWEDQKEYGLNTIYSPMTSAELGLWVHTVSENIIKKFINDSSVPENYQGQKFIKCPLCRKGASTLYQEGFKLPGGLRGHLTGLKYQCFFMKMAFHHGKENLLKT